MRLEIESTDLVAEINGAPARAWRGRTPGGVEVLVYVSAIQVAHDADASELERELVQVAPPSGVCRVCGCTDLNACAGGCLWLDGTHTLCSGCG